MVSSLGERFPPNEEDLTKMEGFVCALYNDPSCNDVNELRYKLFYLSKNLQSHQLPPTKEAVTYMYHLKRANYHAFL